MRSTPSLLHGDTPLDEVAADLRRRDWTVLAIDPAHPLLLGAAAEARNHLLAHRLRPASTGRDDGLRLAGLRGDDTLWLDDPACGTAAADLLQAFEQLRRGLNERLTLGLAHVEAHFAHYPVGTGYARHRDSFQRDDARVLSLVLYLNHGWPSDGGGALRLHLPTGCRDIAPAQGTLALFLSADVEHEVMPATQARFSVSAWFRQRPQPVQHSPRPARPAAPTAFHPA
ncbi:MAG: 2OG-Fe(II) oxygenase [Arenimonas sp.]|uniref:2OG-Fe(II) oxygenase n=1 Tax=Arenimonas sp. TaxID=1872635 RepID=UPI0025C47BD3|nr:2OG-Fe(II) oxygenase [Arenimonas sp.]MBW8366929.1 2OG-Fe(II) oxygenase [Arenimonas sp.]